VLIVDDSAFMRRALRQMIEADPALKVVDTAVNGQEGVEKARLLKPDVVTLDIEMPVMDGLSALRKIRTECFPAPAVLVCSSLTSAGSHEALKALRLGAADVIAKDGSAFALNVEKMRAELLEKIRAVGAGRARKADEQALAPRGLIDAKHRFRPGDFELLTIGSSTGGPPVLETIIGALPADLSVPVIIAQHMPAMFTKSLAERLDQESAVSVVHGEDGMPLHAGTVYVGPGGQHVRVRKAGLAKLQLEVSREPAAALYKPCVNELYSSAARITGQRTLALILTGMGDDGLIGARDLKAKGATIIAQDMPSCVVYGMPRAVAQAGLADGSMAPEEIAGVVRTLAPSAHAATGQSQTRAA
jgi:two-component system chemotaxis response regulator CheB